LTESYSFFQSISGRSWGWHLRATNRRCCIYTNSGGGNNVCPGQGNHPGKKLFLSTCL